KHSIFYMGVQSGSIDFRKVGAEMGIAPECIEVVTKDPKEIRNRFQLFSQSAVAIANGASPVSLF
ncbi:MAG: hypothetical protein K2X81_09330, partial [Candidatus Obscuribacterales bacterium]|nr:hypothetical protein [Candidatus Obscuribacterales bacterium]